MIPTRHADPALRQRNGRRRGGREAPPSYTDLVLCQRLLRQARPYWPHIVGIFLLSLLASPIALLQPLPMKIAIDNVVGSHPLPRFFTLVLPAGATSSRAALAVLVAGLLVAVFLMRSLQQAAESLLRISTGEKLLLGFRSQLFRHAQRLSLSYHDATATADSLYRIEWDAYCIWTLAMDGIIPFIAAAFTLASMFYILVRLDWQLILVALVVVPVLFAITQVSRRRLRRRSEAVKQLESSALAVAQEVLTLLRVVKAFGQEDREQERFVRRCSEGVQARIRLAVAESTFGLFMGLTAAFGMGVVIVVGLHHVQSGVLTLGQLVLMMAYVGQFFGPLQTITGTPAKLQSALASARRAYSLLDQPSDVPERLNAQPLPRATGAVAFHHVSFAYSEDRPVLHDVSFQVSPGARVGIAGTTGAGKSTLVSLLTRFYDPTGGEIRLDGVDLRVYRLADLRSQFAIVLQEPVLLSTSIAENIIYGRPGASEDEMVVAAKAANAHEFIVRLPQGYETPVGERGMQLSGGERQRIALARAFLKDAPILILDEPTSSVDLKTEAVIMEAMERLMRGRTTFMIAHRLSTLANCDLRLEIEHGRLVEPVLAAS